VTPRAPRCQRPRPYGLDRRGGSRPGGRPAGRRCFGGETVDALTDRRRRGDRVEETDDPGLAVRFEGLSPAGPPARLARRAVPNNSATVIMWATESIRRGWLGRSHGIGRPRAPKSARPPHHHGSGDRDHQEVAKRDALEPDRTGTVRSRRRSAGWQQLCRPPGNADALDLLSEPACHDALPHG
jgi:hypothetical protein